jgi:hypothetical protein
MAGRLKNSVSVWKLARDLGIAGTDDPFAAVLKFCERRVKKVLETFPDCRTLTDLLDCVAGKLGTIFEIVTTDEDLRAIQKKYMTRGERIFATLDRELSEEVFAITYRRSKREHWEPEFVSVIDSRGSKASRAYFTKWHELAHLLTLTDQLRLSFRRTHVAKNFNSPEEALMEVIAGHFGFYSPIVKPHISDTISFDAIEALRQKLCPEASQQSALIGIVKAWPQPCLLINARLAKKRGDVRQVELLRSKDSRDSLRAVHVTVNEAARQDGFLVFENMRVPESSIIYRVFRGLPYGEAIENLSSWEASNGSRLGDRLVEIKAKQGWESVDALIIPKSDKRSRRPMKARRN